MILLISHFQIPRQYILNSATIRDKEQIYIPGEGSFCEFEFLEDLGLLVIHIYNIIFKFKYALLDFFSLRELKGKLKVVDRK